MQCLTEFASPALNLPMPQSLHAVFVLELEYCPAPQELHAELAVWPEKKPAAQSPHSVLLSAGE